MKRTEKKRQWLLFVAVTITLAFVIAISACDADGSGKNNGSSPLTGTVSITGVPKVGVQLTAVPATNHNSGLHYQWKAGDDVTGTDLNTYTPVLADFGKLITVTLTSGQGSGSVSGTTSASVAATDITGFEAIGSIYGGHEKSAKWADAAAVNTYLLNTTGGNLASVTADYLTGQIDVPVIGWTSSDYDPNNKGTYTFTATLGTIPSGLINSGSLTANVDIVIAITPAYELRVINDTTLKLQSYLNGTADSTNTALLTGMASLMDDNGRLVIDTGTDGSVFNPGGEAGNEFNIAGQNGVDLPGIAGGILKANENGVSIEMMVKLPVNRVPAGASAGEPAGEYWMNNAGASTANANSLFTISDTASFWDHTAWFRITNAQWWFYKGLWSQVTLLPAGGIPGIDANLGFDILHNNQYRHVIVTIDKNGNAEMFIDGYLVVSANLMNTGDIPERTVTDSHVLDFSQWGTINIWLGKTNLMNNATCQMFIYNFAVFDRALTEEDAAMRFALLSVPGAFDL